MVKPYEPKYVMDASAILAYANKEKYTVDLAKLFNDAIITTYNLTEAVSKAVISTTVDEQIAWDFMSNFITEHYPLDDAIGFEAVKLAILTKPIGLSLGDRYCIALGKILGLPVYTADRSWKTIEADLGVQIELIR